MSRRSQVLLKRYNHDAAAKVSVSLPGPYYYILYMYSIYLALGNFSLTILNSGVQKRLGLTTTLRTGLALSCLHCSTIELSTMLPSWSLVISPRLNMVWAW